VRFLSSVPLWLWPTAPFILLSAFDLAWMVFRPRPPGGKPGQSARVRPWVAGQVGALVLLAASPAFLGWRPRPLSLFVGGCLLEWAGLLTVTASMITLGRFWAMTLAVDGEHRLVHTGPFRRFRHPLYFGLALMALGAAAAWSHPWAVGPALVLLALCTQVRVRLEERVLEDRFGEQWRRFARERWSWLPFLR